MTKTHTFHIPVMGIGFTIDTPLKVSHLGINSVISLVDDILLEKMRKMYSEKFQIPYKEISNKIDDFRAKRVTEYLNFLNDLVDKKIDELKSCASEKSQEIKDYFNRLPESSKVKQEFINLSQKYFNIEDFKSWIKDNMYKGSIDVNIMTKVDKANYLNGEKLPVEFNDAHAALRGFALSNLESSIVLSAGLNPRLYNYIEKFDDFFPTTDGFLKKKIILKVSDYRSAIIQGKYLAKKGLWVSEYRIESGLNCGGHAFASDGFLLGPVLEEFKENKAILLETINEIYIQALIAKEKLVPSHILPIKITAQGGVGTNEEHEFLLEKYGLDSIGWGTPFLLVPEATTVDEATMQQLMDAKEEDLYLSNISPLGVPFNSLRGNTKDEEKFSLIEKGKPGSLCPKKYVALNHEHTEKGLCTASYRYQRLKINELKDENLDKKDYDFRYEKIVEKSCVCVGLGTSALIANNIETSEEGPGVSICPGPNMAYYSKKVSINEMVGHIYGRTNIISRQDRPNIFIKELSLYIDYLKNKIDESSFSFSPKQFGYLSNFSNNLIEGINYYQKMFEELKDNFQDKKSQILFELSSSNKVINQLKIEISNLSLVGKYKDIKVKA
ncbi:MAG: hypothetical protein AUJ98_04025 [Bacteroidetes bacterium CG2_30_33_31]|nr:MAG: hypothetical protein AUJ98_04025 [Bacteroidetes bacterium CG2_30_33_31]